MKPFWITLKVLAQLFLVTPFQSIFMLEQLPLTSIKNSKPSMQPSNNLLFVLTLSRELSYSQILVSVLQALSSNRESLRVQRCRVLLKEFKGKVFFQWVPFHCGLRGNETADFLSKKENCSSPKVL
ncbi:hypothetical protein NPIL_271131 [Nephila pilipes]|uniref:RNase H type-1 domain-containing protein n=1 Tax=Nephila pilipes TaxID=299642 RepID=A0A8X6JC24_NEPPI|nr:hypothetical protein NPIL_271131 [Nephila pilipes]